MMAVQLTGLQDYLGADMYARWLEDHENPEAALAAAESRVLAAIFPLRPDANTMAPFSRAVFAQARADWAVGVPDFVGRVSLGSYSVEMKNRGTLCDEARNVLLAAGLLYRGVKC